jgi:hypothetical protein
MPACKKVFVSIYCKIYTDNFSEEMVDRMATGNEIYEFLMQDAGQCFDDSGNLLPGDCNIWYLGCNEKVGHLQLDDKVWNWSFGESSFDTVEAFVSTLYQKKLISGFQFHTLMGKIDEGRRIDNMYLILDYLICKRDKIPWVKKPNAGYFRDDIKEMVDRTVKSLRPNCYRVHF